MSRIEIKVTDEEYQNVKNSVLQNIKIKKIEINSKEIDISQSGYIVIRGTMIKIGSKVLSSLSKAMGINKSTFDLLNNTFQGTGDKLLPMIMKAIKSNKSANLVLLYNTEIKSIVHVYKEGDKLIEDSTYFETLESVINKTPGAYLRSIIQEENGDLIATVANPNMEFQFNNFSQEVFTAGMTLALTTKKMYTSFFTERLWCSNGCVTTDKLCTIDVKVKSGVPDFMAALLDSEYHINSITEFKKRLTRCYNTTASLNEVLSTERQMRRILGDSVAAERLLSNMSADRLIREFGPNFMEKKGIHKFLYTDMTLWDLVNEVTAVSSSVEQKGLPVTEDQNLKIQILGGDRMFNIPDLAPNNIKQLYTNKGVRRNK